MSINNEELTLAVYAIIQLIPKRKVVTCGQIAKLLHKPSATRRIREGPWYRVVSTSCIISNTGACAQSDALEAEGVKIYTGSSGELRVLIEECGWLLEARCLEYVWYCVPQSTVEWGS
ncbi:hypothetical protein CONPUDRAFT_74505 [Coniophora puteana RWD-64-598 SS2]|uniref:Methylated-DNA-[protein]-cysteine S-methyltransferase DNA binding domain-containing protein n=1 Tax=Coniophora puteana (strain RWD-64-598) TaxID=741705 RepID=A0A5M3MI78_CONPW|nr:uncharacterized protein CONPUDRAFT_74505 [Coniophora puteana RWD-64-598 SS2]EIW78949.1 hypothetical protein CONPUDRAFT_74505 [Coniophora puteana RWD-64-598 SS2]